MVPMMPRNKTRRFPLSYPASRETAAHGTGLGLPRSNNLIAFVAGQSSVKSAAPNKNIHALHGGMPDVLPPQPETNAANATKTKLRTPPSHHTPHIRNPTRYRY
jgi:hypothetical protein